VLRQTKGIWYRDGRQRGRSLGGTGGQNGRVEIQLLPCAGRCLPLLLCRNPADFPFVIDFAQSLYSIAKDGLLIGMSNPAEKHVFDQKWTRNSSWSTWRLDFSSARVEKAGMVSHWAGLYEVTPDAHPFFGKTPVDGFLVVVASPGMASCTDPFRAS